MIFHRGSAFRDLYATVCTKLLPVFGATASSKIIILTGSGTLANETVLSSVFGYDDQVLVLVNGDFGERLAQILTAHQIKVRVLSVPWGVSFDLDAVELEIADSMITGVAMVAMETSTGMVNPVHRIGQLCRRSGRLFFVDAISALGAEDINMERDCIDICTAVPNKGLEGPPGLALVCARSEVLEIRRPSRPHSIYLDLYRYLDFAEDNQTPTTPAVSLVVALEVALNRLITEGLADRRKRYHELSKYLRTEVGIVGIGLLLSEQAQQANAVTTLCLPTEVDTLALHKYLFAHGITVWRPVRPGPLAHYNILQVSVMGDIGIQEVIYFITLVRRFLGIDMPTLTLSVENRT